MTNQEWKKEAKDFLDQILEMNNGIPNSVVKHEPIVRLPNEQYYLAKTIFGDYQFRLEFNGGKKHTGFTVFGRFLDSTKFKEASKRLRSNPHSGKWNLHIYESNFGDEHFFLNDLEKIIEETKQV